MLLHWVCCDNDVLVKVHEENVASQIYAAGTGILKDSSNNYEHSYLILVPRLWYGIWNHINKLFLLLHMKIQMVYLKQSEWIIYQGWPCFITHWSLRKYWFTKLWRAPKCLHISLCDTLKKKSHLISSLILLENSSIGKLSSLQWWIWVSRNSDLTGEKTFQLSFLKFLPSLNSS